nr:hypothetical protein [Candidatus Sigynarchaeota archaeon]
MLALSFLSFLSTVIINQLVPPENVFVRSLAAVNYSVIIVIFTKFAFYTSRKSNFKIMLVIVIILRAIHFTEMNLLGFVTPSYVPIPAEDLGWYYFHVLMIASQLTVALSWLSYSAFKAYTASTRERVEPWVRNRYLIVGFSNFFYIFLSFSFFLIPTDGLAYAGPNALLADAVILPVLFTYVVLSTLTWVMPDWFKKILNAGQALTTLGKDSELFHEVSPSIADRVITKPELMKVLDYLGNKLAIMIKKSPGAAKGLLFISIEKELGEFGLYVIKLENLLRVVNNSLKQIMKEMHIDDADKIAADLNDEILKNQSVIFMMSV